MGLTGSRNSDEEEYETSLEEILEIKSILISYLPKELVDIIVDEAYFCLCATYKQDYGTQHPYRIEAGADDIPPFDRQRCCGMTPEMSIMVPHPYISIKAVRFIICSHDQGWGGEPGLEGEYEGSWTWFEAKIVRHKPGQSRERRDSLKESFIMKDLDMGTHEWIDTVQNPYATTQQGGTTEPRGPAVKPDFWPIQRNVRANNDFREHVVAWNIDDEIDSDSEQSILDEEGVGQGAGFVEMLRREDRIAVMARAKYPGWVNFVKSVTIQVFYTI